MKFKTLKLNNYQGHAFWTCVGLIVIFISLYIYFVNVTIFLTAERSNTEEALIDLKSSISQLELEFIEETRSLTINYAHELGFQKIGKPIFVKRDNNTRLTLNDL
jgi:hypothetical protein